MSAALINRVQTLTLPRGNCEEIYRENIRNRSKFYTISKLFYDIIAIIINSNNIMIIVIIIIITSQ